MCVTAENSKEATIENLRQYIGKENSKFGWFILFIALSGSIALSSMALILPTITILILMFIYAIKDKKIS